MGFKNTEEQTAFFNEVLRTPNNVALRALAGSGKTFSLVEACKLIDPTERILALAFNKNIADELNERLPRHAKAQTLNSLGHRAWQRYIGQKKLVVERDKVGKVLRSFCKDDPDLWEHWTGLATLISKARLHGIVPEGAQGKYSALMEDTDENWSAIILEYDLQVPTNYTLYRELLTKIIDLSFDGEIDFDDQIYMSTVWNVRIDTFDVILIDEAQDLSDMQHQFIDKMMDDTTRIIVAGDANQSIYAFRGSTSDSLGKLVKRYDCKEMPLTVSFRCPKAVIKVAQEDVPDIKAKEDAEQGEVITLKKWDAEDIESRSTILCRNVAPLVRTTYRLIASGRPAVMQGRDIGRGLITLIKNIIKPDKAMAIADFLDNLADWKDNEISIARSKGQPWREDSVRDKAESLIAVQRYSRAKDTDQLASSIEKLFAVGSSDKILLSTIHKAKGFEWDTVYFLDQWRVPSSYAKEAVAKDPVAGKEQMQQEYNLRYVAVTRAKKKLIYIDSNKFKSEEGELEEGVLDGTNE